MRYKKPNILFYRLAQVLSWVVAVCVFRRKIVRNEIKGKNGPFVVIANHETMLDFVNLIGTTSRAMSFVISSSFYNSLPIKGIMNKMGVIPKQQFQTTVGDMRQMKSVIDNGQPLVIYPAGLMCEDGLSTPIPAATYKFLKWLKADVYVARSSGTYFVMPKWSKGMRPGRTYIDVYKLFDKDELADLSEAEIKEKTDKALLFDAYREQDEKKIKYLGGSKLAGLEHVLHMCPHCMSEFSMEVRDGSRLVCRKCAYEQVSDEYALLSRKSAHGPELRYVSDWSRFIQDSLRKRVEVGEEHSISSSAEIHMVDPVKNKFVHVGRGKLSLSRDGFTIDGELGGEPVELSISIANVPALPFSPGRYIEVQHGENIYRCFPEDGRIVIKYINLLKIFYELNMMTHK